MSKQKQKGTAFETETARKIQALGINAWRVPLSGALGGKFRGDIQFAGLIAECKRRKKNFSFLYKSLEQDQADCLFVRDDQKETMVVMPWKTFELFLEWAKLKQLYPVERKEQEK